MCAPRTLQEFRWNFIEFIIGNLEEFQSVKSNNFGI